METTVKHLYVPEVRSAKVTLWKRFIAWCDGQEYYRLGWLGAALTLHGCVLTIFAMFAVVLSGNHFIFWPFIIAAMGATMVVNLAAMPTKITIPVFFVSILVDLVIMASCIIIGFDAGGTII